MNLPSVPAPTEDVIGKLLDPSQPSNDPAVRLLQIALSGFGYDFHDPRNSARANDVLLREKGSDLLSRAANRLDELECRYREQFIPPASRERPFPPADTSRRAAALHRAGQRLQSLATTLLTAETPAADAIWGKVRNELGTLRRLVGCDVRVIAACTAVAGAVDNLTPSACNADDALAALELEVETLERTLRERRAMLTI